MWCVPPLKSALKIGWFPGDGMTPFVRLAAASAARRGVGLIFVFGHKTVTEDHGCQKLTELNKTKSCMSFSPTICI